MTVNETELYLPDKHLLYTNALAKRFFFFFCKTGVPRLFFDAELSCERKRRGRNCESRTLTHVLCLFSISFNKNHRAPQIRNSCELSFYENRNAGFASAVPQKQRQNTKTAMKKEEEPNEKGKSKTGKVEKSELD